MSTERKYIRIRAFVREKVIGNTTTILRNMYVIKLSDYEWHSFIAVRNLYTDYCNV